MSDGAVHLKRVIKQLGESGLPDYLRVSDMPEGLIKIEKVSLGSENRTEFSFLIKPHFSGAVETWWPVSHVNQNGDVIAAESLVNGRTLTNLHIQNELVALAESWAKAIEAQATAKSIQNALL